jgi:hypothetical protein
VTPRGYQEPLYTVPFDERAAFKSRVFGFEAPLAAAQTTDVAGTKWLIYDGCLAVRAGPAAVDRQHADRRAKRRRPLITAMCAKKRAQADFDFQYGVGVAAGIEAFNMMFCEVPVRFNPEGD